VSPLVFFSRSPPASGSLFFPSILVFHLYSLRTWVLAYFTVRLRPRSRRRLVQAYSPSKAFNYFYLHGPSALKESDAPNRTVGLVRTANLFSTSQLLFVPCPRPPSSVLRCVSLGNILYCKNDLWTFPSFIPLRLCSVLFTDDPPIPLFQLVCPGFLPPRFRYVYFLVPPSPDEITKVVGIRRSAQLCCSHFLFQYVRGYRPTAHLIIVLSQFPQSQIFHFDSK